MAFQANQHRCNRSTGLSRNRVNNLQTVSLAAMIVVTAQTSALFEEAVAGGFAIREQSAMSQGTSFAGSAAGDSLSSMFWNAAAASAVSGPGINVDSNYSVISPFAEVTVDTIGGSSATPGFFGAESGDIAPPAIVGATYASYQLSDKMFVGISLNSPFGLTTKPQNLNYAGNVLGRTSKLLTLSASPTISYELFPGFFVGAGAQVQYA
ncbi:MAG: outer membrane protein transport protein, partial [Pseudomonadota bacterium]